MLERDVESKLKWLEGFGFEVLKLITPGTMGVMDRLILAPKWSPAPPVFVEIKRPGKSERALQAARRDDWRARGCDVADMCSTYEEIRDLREFLITEAVKRYMAKGNSFWALPGHIRVVYNNLVGLPTL